MTKLLQEGDVIELKEGMKVFADIPRHFIYENSRGDFTLERRDICLGGNFDYLCGKYIVVKTCMDGGGETSNDSVPDGWHVFCVMVDDKTARVDFYQSGHSIAMIENIEPVGRAKLDWLWTNTDKN